MTKSPHTLCGRSHCSEKEQGCKNKKASCTSNEVYYCYTDRYDVYTRRQKELWSLNAGAHNWTHIHIYTTHTEAHIDQLIPKLRTSSRMQTSLFFPPIVDLWTVHQNGILTMLVCRAILLNSFVNPAYTSFYHHLVWYLVSNISMELYVFYSIIRTKSRDAYIS